MNEKEKENLKEAEEEGIWVREQRKRKRKRSRRRRRREEELADRKEQGTTSISMELVDWLDLAPARDRGQRQRQWTKVKERVG